MLNPFILFFLALEAELDIVTVGENKEHRELKVQYINANILLKFCLCTGALLITVISEQPPFIICQFYVLISRVPKRKYLKVRFYYSH